MKFKINRNEEGKIKNLSTNYKFVSMVDYILKLEFKN